MSQIRNVVYGDGGYDPTKPNDNILSDTFTTVDDATGEVTQIVVDGQVTYSNPSA